MRSLPLSVRAVGLTLLIAGQLVPELAHADPSPQDVTLAETLFREGKGLMDEQRYEEACPKFEESHRLDPAGGTTLNLAVCYDEAGLTANAWAAYSDALVYAQRENRADRIAMIEQRQRALEANLSRVTVTVVSPQEDMVVTIDDSALRRPAWSVATPINPGRHHLEASAPGFETFAVDFEIPARKGDVSITVPALTASQPTRSSAAASEHQGPSRPEGRNTPSDPGRTERTTGLALGGTGLALIGVGSYFGVQALQQKAESDDACPNDQCSAMGARLSRDAGTSANVANITIGLGLVAIGLGTYFFLDGSRQAEDVARKTLLVPVISRHSGGLTFRTTL